MVCLPKPFLLDQLLVVLTVELYINTELWSVTCSDAKLVLPDRILIFSDSAKVCVHRLSRV